MHTFAQIIKREEICYFGGGYHVRWFPTANYCLLATFIKNLLFLGEAERRKKILKMDLTMVPEAFGRLAINRRSLRTELKKLRY